MAEIVEGLGDIGRTSTKLGFYTITAFMVVVVVVAVVSLIKAKLDKEDEGEIGVKGFGVFMAIVFAFFMIGGSWIMMKGAEESQGFAAFEGAGAIRNMVFGQG